MPRKGRSDSVDQDGGRRSRASSQTSHKSKRGSSQPPQTQGKPPKKKSKQGENKENVGQQKNNMNIPPELRKYVLKIIRDAQTKRPDRPIQPDLLPDTGNDLVVSNDNITQKGGRVYAAGRTWSSYPVPLPPQMHAKSVHDLRKALKNANSKELLSYYSNEVSVEVDKVVGGKTVKEKQITKPLGHDYDLGLLECYDGISENDQGNFLSCDFVNPAYLHKMQRSSKVKNRMGVAPVQSARDAVPEWLPHQSCFVYAPPGTILSEGNSNRTLIEKQTAQSNWKSYGNGTAIRKAASPDVTSQHVLSHVWCYDEEFVPFKSRDKHPAHKSFDPLDEKGRIGMMFPITPLDQDEADLLSELYDVPSDSIGWGKISRIGNALPENFVKEGTTWDAVQSKIGRYILVTNLWSATKQDRYDVHVENDVLKKIYNKVYEMTKGDMYVNVRRGSAAYGRLFVVQKKIVLDPEEDSFGIVSERQADLPPKTNLYVTQIFTCMQTQTKYDPKWERTPITAAYKNHKTMSDEEKNLSNMFQTTNNRIIQCMKSEQYRNVMEAFWKDDPAGNKAALMKAGETTWTMETMKAMLQTMLLTSYDVMFQRLPTKAACRERYIRFMDVLKNYKVWFVQNKCWASDAFVEKYEKKLADEAIQPESFSFRNPATQYEQQEDSDSVWNPAVPVINATPKENGLVKMFAQNAKSNGDDNKHTVLQAQVEELKRQVQESENARALEAARAAEAAAIAADAGKTAGRGGRAARRDGAAANGPAGGEAFSVFPDGAGSPKADVQRLEFVPTDTDSFSTRLARIQDW